MRIIVNDASKVALVREIFRRTNDYIKTKEILIREYGIHIHLEVSNLTESNSITATSQPIN